MRRIFLLILLSTAFASPAGSQQDAADEATEAEQTEVTPEADEVDEAEVAEETNVEEPVVDDEFYQDVDDEDFRPSEDVPADQSIPFPSDI